MSDQKRIGLEGTIKAYAGCSRIIATIQRASSTELPAESGEKRRRTVPVKVRPFCASKQQKNAPIFIDSKPIRKPGRLPDDLRDHLGGVGGTRG